MKNISHTKTKSGAGNKIITAIAFFGGYITNTLYIFFRFIGIGIAAVGKTLWNATDKIRKKARKGIKKGLAFIFRPLIETVKYIFKEIKRSKKEQKENGGKISLKSRLALIGNIIFGKKGAAVLLASFAVPIISIFFLFSIITYASSINYAVKLTVNGNFLGYIDNEQVFLDAKEVLNDRISVFGGDIDIPAEASYSVEQIGNIETLTKYQIADLILGKSGVNLDYGYGFYINNVFYGALMDFTNVKETLDDLLGRYETGNESEKINFVDMIRYDEAGLYLADSFIDENWLISLLTGTKQQSSYYTVELNDSPFLISQKLGIKTEELDKLNPGFSESDLHIGDKIKISEEIPFLSISTTRTEVYTKEDIPYDTETYDDDTIYEGQSRIKQEGEYGINELTANVTYVNGVETGRDITKVVSLKKPVTEIIALGCKKTPAGTIKDTPTAYGKLAWPLDNNVGEISQWSQWEGGYYGHKGIDLAAPYGSYVYAGAAGVVTKVAYSNVGLGYHIYIYHEELGITSVYGHNSSMFVKEGQRVAQGECIAAVGSTGQSTGPHVHLGVIIKGSSVNPHNYLDIPPNVRINLVK